MHPPFAVTQLETRMPIFDANVYRIKFREFDENRFSFAFR
jgi:hypothetical protein